MRAHNEAGAFHWVAPDEEMFKRIAQVLRLRWGVVWRFACTGCPQVGFAFPVGRSSGLFSSRTTLTKRPARPGPADAAGCGRPGLRLRPGISETGSGFGGLSAITAVPNPCPSKVQTHKCSEDCLQSLDIQFDLAQTHTGTTSPIVGAAAIGLH